MQSLNLFKIGGELINDPMALTHFLEGFATLDGPKILVHGGGKIATEMEAALGVESILIDGRRVTGEATLRVVTMVYAGLINKNIVATLQSMQCNAIGLCGADADIVPAIKREVKDQDYGFVGDPDSSAINTNAIRLMIENGIVPVLSSITHDRKGTLSNTNADTVSCVLAVALSREYDVSLKYCFDKIGVLRDVNDPHSVLPSITPSQYHSLKNEGLIAGGMIPKLDNGFLAVKCGVHHVSISHTRDITTSTDPKHHAGTILCL